MEEKKVKKHWGSRFGYLMVASGAAVGLGNIWRFPYLAYQGGGGCFLVLYLLAVVFFAHPLVIAETAIGRFGKANVAHCYEKINKKWRFVGVIAALTTFSILLYYVVVSGWVGKYTLNYIIGSGFGEDKQIFFDSFIASTWQPIIFTGIYLAICAAVVYFGITNTVEKFCKYSMPLMLLMLIGIGCWVLTMDGAMEGLKYYLIPDFTKFSWKTLADACTQCMFSVGIGWGIYATLGSNIPDSNGLKSDAVLVSICDTSVALIAGFTVLPSLFAAGIEPTSGKALVFVVMNNVFETLPGGRWIGIVFFIVLLIAVITSTFTLLEIVITYVEERFRVTHGRATLVTTLALFTGSILVSLGFGVLSFVKLPWIDMGGFVTMNIYDWLDTVTAYILLPLGCLLTALVCSKVWGFKEYDKEIRKNGKEFLTKFDKFCLTVVVPIVILIILLNCFGFIK